MHLLNRSRRTRGRRWRAELTAAEDEQIRSALNTPASPRMMLRILARSPGLLPEIARSFSTAFRAALQGDNVLVWLLQAERVRLIVPDAATGVSWHEEDVFVDRLREFLGAEKRALELGCGAGRVSKRVASDVGELIASDVSARMLREAKTNLKEHPNVRFVRTRGFALDQFADGEFDVVFAHGVLGHLDPFPLLALLAESRRVLRAGGHCLANFHLISGSEDAEAALREAVRSATRNRLPAADRPYTADQIRVLYEAAGFVETRISESTGANSVVVGTAP